MTPDIKSLLDYTERTIGNLVGILQDLRYKNAAKPSSGYIDASASMSKTDIENIMLVSSRHLDRRSGALKRHFLNAKNGVKTFDDAVYVFAHTAINTFPTGAYDVLHPDSANPLPAIALWMLSQIAAAGRLMEAISIIPPSYHRTAVANSVFPETLVAGLCDIITQRDSEVFPGCFYVTPKTWKANRKDDEYVYKKKSGMSFRDRFNSIIGLIPKEVRLAAVKHFMECVHENERFIIEDSFPLWLNHCRIRAVRTELNNPLLNRANTLELLRNSGQNRYHASRISTSGQYIGSLLEFESTIKVLKKPDLWLDKKNLSFSGGRMKDPYEILFAALYLLDTGADIMWMPNMVYNVLYAACINLPWCKEERDENYIQPAQKVFNKTRVAPPLIKVLYTKENENGMMAVYEPVLSVENIIMANNYRNWIELAYLDFYGDGDDAEDIKSEEPLKSEDEALPEDRTEEEFNVLSARNKELKLKISSLTELLRIKNEGIASLREKVDTLSNELIEKEDDLNSLLDSLQDNESATETGTENYPLVSWPYSVSKNTLVFGGHDTFKKSFKLLLTGNITFVDKDEKAFDPNIISGADVVWVQSNSISHAMFNKVSNLCRTAGKSMKYLSFASAKKCAVQVMTEDAS